MLQLQETQMEAVTMAKRFANAERDIQEHPSLHQVSSLAAA